MPTGNWVPVELGSVRCIGSTSVYVSISLLISVASAIHIMMLLQTYTAKLLRLIAGGLKH